MKHAWNAWKAVTLSLLAACASAESAPNVTAPPAPAAEPAKVEPPPVETPPPPKTTAPSEPFEVWRRREPIYELYVRHFSQKGDFKGVEERLPELKALGIGIVWLLPVNEIGSITPANGGIAFDAPHGNPYAVKSYEKLNPEYGTEADLKSLVARAHELGMHVILDWVPNHTAWDSELVTKHPEFYARKDNGAIRPVSDEFAWIAQLDWKKKALHAYMSDVMAKWVETFDLDGFRIDFAHAMPLEFFQMLRPKLETKKKVFLLAEAGNVDFHPTFDMTYDWNVYPLLGDVAHGHKAPSAIDDALLHTQLVPYASKPDALVMRMTYNHDDNGKFTLAGRYKEGIKAFAVLASTLPGKPLVFDGQEVGMNVFDGESVKASINLGHDPKVKIDWNDPDGFRPFYTKLLRLFRANPALHQPGMADFRKIDLAPSAQSYAFVRREGKDNTVLVMLNLSPNSSTLTLEPAANAGSIGGDYVDLFTGLGEHVEAKDAFTLGPWGYRVFVRGPTE